MWPFKKQQSEAEPPKPKQRMARHYNAAKTDRLTGNWHTNPTPINQTIMMQLQALRARSREQYANNDYARKFVSMVKNNVVGPSGIVLQANIRSQKGRSDTAASDAIEKAWKRWMKRMHCDVSGLNSFVNIQNLAMSSMAIDGEFLARKIKGRQAGQYGFQLQLLDPELLDPTYHDELPGGNYVLMSIEYNSVGKPVAYHLIERNQHRVNEELRKKRHRIPADEIIHLFISEHAQQRRGIPWMSTALLRMKNLSGYEHAAVVASRIGAS